MGFLTKHHTPNFPAVLPQQPPSPSGGCSKPKKKDPWDYGFKRLAPLLHSPPFSAGILAITLLIFIVLFSDLLLAQIPLETLGITVTVGSFGLLALILFILFLF